MPQEHAADFRLRARLQAEADRLVLENVQTFLTLKRLLHDHRVERLVAL